MANKKRKMSNHEVEQSSFQHIPEDIIIEILQRLPTISLAKFFCVSKRWRCLINNCISLTRPKILFKSKDFIHGDSTMRTCLSLIDNQCRVEKVRLDIPCIHDITIHNSCNGHVLVETDSYFYLWNPVTNYTQRVRSRGGIVLGLCHDTFADKYKVVVANKNYNHKFYDHAYVMVVGHGDGNHAKVNFGYYCGSLRPGPVLNGYLHSLATKLEKYRLDSSRHIIAFNPVTNFFSEVPMPEHRNICNDFVAGLRVLGGCLCIALMESSIGTSNIEILVMKNYGVGSSWALMCSMRSDNGFGYIHTLVPLCYNNNGEALVHVNGRRIEALNFTKNCSETLQKYLGIINTMQFPMKRTGVDHLTSQSFRSLGSVWSIYGG